MPDNFQFDVFLSHSSKDKPIVRPLAERLRLDGLKVWFDEWEIRPGDNIPSKIEEGLERSRVLIFCMSSHAFGSDWAQLESGTFRFRDPLNKDRRFIPLRLDEAPPKGSLAQFRYIDWLPSARETQYQTLIDACGFEKRQNQNEHRIRDRLIHSRREEWNRVRSDFEIEARKYSNLKLSIFFVSKDEPPTLQLQDFPKPNHAINLWQYCGSAQSPNDPARFGSERLTDFGITGAELSAFGVIFGEKTELFCKMANRSGSLLPDEVNHIITAGITEKFSNELGPGKPIVAGNVNALAKWLNLMLVVTTISHPERFRNGKLTVDPFVASLSVFDYLGSRRSDDNLTIPPESLSNAWSGLRGFLEQTYSTKVIKGILGKSGLPISDIKYSGTYKGLVLDEVDRLVNSLNRNARDRFVFSCIEEIFAFERSKAASLVKQGAQTEDHILNDLKIVMARFGHDLSSFEPK